MRNIQNEVCTQFSFVANEIYRIVVDNELWTKTWSGSVGMGWVGWRDFDAKNGGNRRKLLCKFIKEIDLLRFQRTRAIFCFFVEESACFLSKAGKSPIIEFRMYTRTSKTRFCAILKYHLCLYYSNQSIDPTSLRISRTKALHFIKATQDRVFSSR